MTAGRLRHMPSRSWSEVTRALNMAFDAGADRTSEEEVVSNTHTRRVPHAVLYQI